LIVGVDQSLIDSPLLQAVDCVLQGHKPVVDKDGSRGASLAENRQEVLRTGERIG
jgi:hypothetical protein